MKKSNSKEKATCATTAPQVVVFSGSRRLSPIYRPLVQRVVEAVKAGEGSIGYADSSQAAGIASVKVKVGSEFVEHSPEGAAIALDASKVEDGRTDGDLAFAIDRTTTADGAYPVLLVSYLIGCAEYEDENVAALTKAFFTTAISAEGQDAAATNAGSAPISDDLRTQAQAAIDLIK